MNAGRAINWALLAVSAAATLFIGIFAARVAWHALGYFSEGEPDTTAPIAAEREAIDIAPILALAPFGVAPGPATEADQAVLSSLVLRGVILARPERASAALIAQDGGEVRTFAIGETLAGGAVLNSVAADHVILEIGGGREKLSFPEGPSSSPGVAAIRAAIPGAGVSSSGSTAPSTQETINTYRQKIADSPQTVIDELGVSASPEGYRVGPNMGPGVRRAGLQPGDLVVRVNGVPVGDIEKDRTEFENIVASGRARVEVMRDNRLLILSFPLR